jgi:hypothetical protein
MKKHQVSSRNKVVKTTSFVIATLFALSTAVPMAAAQAGCIYTPPLDKAHQVTDKALGFGVKALAWQFEPGSDASGASLSPLGAKVSVVTGNLRHITFGVLHQGVPREQNLKVLADSNPKTMASLNGDYFDSRGPWNAMVEGGKIIYSPPGESGVIGLSRYRVSDARGYRSTGTLTIGTRKFNITGVNQLEPGATSLVVYRSNFIRPLTPKGQVTFQIKSGKISKIYPAGAAISSKAGTVVQVRGYLAPIIAKMKAKTTVRISLPPVPQYEDRMSADNVTSAGSISSKSNTLVFDSVNFPNLSTTGSTLFDSNYVGTTRAGRTTIRISPDAQGNQIVRSVRSGIATKVDLGGFVIQAKSSSASLTASRFRVGDVVTVSRSFISESKSQFVSAAGRGPRIVQGSKMVWVCALHNKEHRPRSAIGWNQDGQVWLITSSRGYDAFDFGYRQGGSTSSQMAQWLLSLGATDAVLLDGGGSTTMQINLPDVGSQRFDLPDVAWWRELANAFSIERKN